MESWRASRNGVGVARTADPPAVQTMYNSYRSSGCTESDVCGRRILDSDPQVGPSGPHGGVVKCTSMFASLCK